MGAAGLLGLMFAPRVRRRRRRCADQPGVRRGAVAVHLRRLHHHRAGPHRHGEPAPAPCRHAGAEGRVPAARHARRADHARSASPSRARARTWPASARRAQRDGDHWVLNGTKMFITNGVHADLYFVAAKTGAARHDDLDVHRREGHAGLHGRPRARRRPAGCRSDTAELVFDNVRIPAGQPAGRGGQGLLFGDEELPDRAHRAGRDGGRATASRR